jgi:hypothetical protein
MSKATFQLVYDGPALAENEIAVRDLSPALMAMDALLEEANRVVNYGKTDTTLTVKASFKTGSFKIDLASSQQLIERLKDIKEFVLGDTVTTILSAEALIALVFGTLWRLMKWLRGRKITKVQLLDGKVQVWVDNEYLEVEKQALDLLRSYKVRQALEQAVKEPLEKDGIDTVAIVEKEEVIAVVTKEERMFFSAEQLDVTQLEDTTRITHLHLVAPSFQTGDKWRVNDGGSNFYVGIEDQAFIEKVLRGDVGFTATTILKVSLREVQFTDSKGQMKKECTIREVLEIRDPGEQMSLFPEPEPHSPRQDPPPPSEVA